MKETRASATANSLFVLFGASGDLARRKLFPALFRLFRSGNLPEEFRLIGYGRTDMTAAAFRELVGRSVGDDDASDEDVREFTARFSFIRGSYADAGDLARLAAAISENCGGTIFYYLALPPTVCEKLMERFAEGTLPTGDARILLEKPFGSDLASARRLNALLAARFPEEHVHRIDHYLAKDTVRNLLVFRFANIIFEPIWNRHYVDHIQVSAAETLGVEERGGFYDGAGVVRDMLQNHVMMLLALATMEPPVAGDTESQRDHIADLLKSVAAPARGDYVFGQYEGYRRAKNVAPDSRTPTFAALRLGIGNWRWEGVPVYLVSGKCLDARVSEVSLVFKRIPLCLLDEGTCGPVDPNVLTLRIQPNEGIRLSLGVKHPGHRDLVVPSAMDFRYANLNFAGGGEALDKALGSFDASGHHLFTGYERVLLEALAGRPGLFWRADAIESAWRIVEPLLDPNNLPPAEAYPTYKPGTSGIDLAAPLFTSGQTQWYASNFSSRLGARE